MNRSIRLSMALLATVLSTQAAAREPPALSQKFTSVRAAAEPLQLTPESVTVISADELDQVVLGSLEDLEGMAPGLVVDPMSRAPQGAAISLRGIGSGETSSMFFPAVAVKVDGVYVGTHAGQNPVIFDFDRVEIARGPQGALEATPNLGGAINVYRSRPTGDLAAHAVVATGNRNRTRFGTVLHFPVTAALSGKLAVDWQDGGGSRTNKPGIVDNAFSARRENETRRNGLSMAFRWQQEGLDLQYTHDRIRDDSDVPALLNLSPDTDLLCSTSVDEAHCSLDGDGFKPETDSLSLTTQNFGNARDYQVDQHALVADFSFMAHDVTSITAWRDTFENSSQDLDATFSDFYSATTREDYQQFSQELTFTRQYSPALRYAFGASFLSQRYDRDRVELFVLPAIAAASRILPTTPGETRDSSTRQKTRHRSLFAFADYQLGDLWRVDAGLRWHYVESDLLHRVTNPDNFINNFSGGSAILDGFDERNELTGSAGIAYTVDEDAMIYFRAGHGFRPGGFDDTVNTVDAAAPFAEEKIDTIEIGLKSQWWDRRLRLNYATYQNNYRDKLERFTQTVASGRVESVLGNVARVEVRGHEVEIEAVPLDNLVLRAALSHMNADYIEYQVPDLAAAGSTLDQSGAIPAWAPADLFQVSGRYGFPYRSGRINIHAGYRFTTEYWSNPLVPVGRVNNFTIIDLSVDYEWRAWRIRLFSRNFNDKRYLTNVTRVHDAQLASLPPTTDTALALTTSAEPSLPKFTGIEIRYVPTFGR